MKVRNAKRGRIEKIELSKVIVLNGFKIFEAIIEIDHINKGLDEKTGLLKKRSRTNFTIRDIARFRELLDGEDLAPVKRKCTKSRFVIKINSPIRRVQFDRLFIMIFEHDTRKSKEIYMITIYPNGEL